MTLQSPAMAFAASAADNDENDGNSSYSEQINDSEAEEEPEEEPADEPEYAPTDEPKDDPEEDPEGEPADPENSTDPVDPVDPEEPVEEPEKEPEQETKKADEDEIEEIFVFEKISLEDSDLPDNDELFAGYFEREFFGNGSATYGTTAGSKLTGTPKTIYNNLREKIESVAQGNLSSAKFDISSMLTSDPIVITGEVLNDTNGELTTAGQDAVKEKLASKDVIDALLADLPYDLYWFDKTVGCGLGYSYTYLQDGSTVTLTKLQWTFTVASDYRNNVSGDDAAYSVNTDKTSATSTAKANAQAVVTKNTSKTDLQKLAAYKYYICDAVEYNDEAASDSYSGGYGDPWQLIYVFDGSNSTNVVCEGYSKAFQYLCDLSNIECWSVSGKAQVLDGNDKPGAHMWNIVQLDGVNYHCDITWVDGDGSSGYTDLFMCRSVTATGENNKSHTFSANGKSVKYEYDEDMADLYCDGYPAITAAATKTAIKLNGITITGGITKEYDGSKTANFAASDITSIEYTDT